MLYTEQISCRVQGSTGFKQGSNDPEGSGFIYPIYKGMNPQNEPSTLKKENWLDKQVSIYTCLADNKGRAATYRDILLSDFAMDHDWYFKDHTSGKWISGNSNDLQTIIDLRTSEITKKERVMLKSTMQCFTPAGLLKTKKQGQIEEINRTGIIQLDWDYPAIQDYDLEELKQAVFALPFIAFCGVSCSGNGFYALAAIAEPYKLTEYAEHLFQIFKEYDIPVDTSKGRNVNDLRFVSYDANMLIKEDPEPLKIKRFATKKQPKPIARYQPNKNNTAIVNKAIQEISEAVPGYRWQTVQKWSYTLGGLGDISIIDQVKTAINNSSNYTGEESKYCECADKCFLAGSQNPIKNETRIF